MSRNSANRYTTPVRGRNYGYAGGYVYGSAAPKRVPEKESGSRIDVVPGGVHGRAAEKSKAHSLAVKAAKATVVGVIVFSGIGFGRITLAAATVSEALEAREVTASLEEARSEISQLEVQQSSLSNPTRIKSEAAALGMSSPEVTYVIDLEDDVVVTDASGSLSLAKSIESAATRVPDGR